MVLCAGHFQTIGFVSRRGPAGGGHRYLQKKDKLEERDWLLFRSREEAVRWHADRKGIRL